MLYPTQLWLSVAQYQHLAKTNSLTPLAYLNRLALLMLSHTLAGTTLLPTLIQLVRSYLVLPLLSTQLISQHPLVLTLSQAYQMLAPLFSLSHHLTCTAGVRIPLLPPNFSSMARTASQSVRAHTLTSSSPTSTTLAHLTPVSMYTHSPSAQRSTSHQAHAISHALTMPHSSLSFPMLPLAVPTLPKYVSTPLTTMFSVSCPVWVALHTLIKYVDIIFFKLNW